MTSDERREYLRAWRERNAERLKADRAAKYAEIKADPEKWAVYIAAVSERTKRRRAANPEAYREWLDSYQAANRDRIREQRHAYRYGSEEGLVKDQAWRRVKLALKSGRLKREPCEVCGTARVHAHHDDYAHPLAVRWLCPSHHALLHAELRKAA